MHIPTVRLLSLWLPALDLTMSFIISLVDMRSLKLPVVDLFTVGLITVGLISLATVNDVDLNTMDPVDLFLWGLLSQVTIDSSYVCLDLDLAAIHFIAVSLTELGYNKIFAVQY